MDTQILRAFAFGQFYQFGLMCSRLLSNNKKRQQNVLHNKGACKFLDDFLYVLASILYIPESEYLKTCIDNDNHYYVLL